MVMGMLVRQGRGTFEEFRKTAKMASNENHVWP